MTEEVPTSTGNVSGDIDEYISRIASGCRSIVLGGVGAGHLELTADGWFRNVSLFDPNSPSSVLLADAYFALRCATLRQSYVRILQHEPDRERVDGSPKRVKPDQLIWKGLFPCADYRLADARAPVQAVWSAFAPLIPFDYEASTLPAVFFAAQLANSGQEPVEVSVLFNWPCRGCGSVDFDRIVSAYCGDEDERAQVKKRVPPNALLFESADHGDGLCIVVDRAPGIAISAATWDSSERASRKGFWRSFQETGYPTDCAASKQVTEGALCARFALSPGERRRVQFVLAWHAAGASPHAPSYQRRFGDALGVAAHALKHLKYLYGSVQGWRNRLLTSSLPEWLSHLLINSCSAFVTLGRARQDGSFALLSPSDNRWAEDPRLFRSLALLLFFPRFESAEMLDWAARLQSRRSDPPAESVVHFLLCIYRDYFLTGDLVRLKRLLPAMEAALERWLRPETRAGFPLSIVPEEAPVTAGLWLVALRACGRLMLEHGRGPSPASWRKHYAQALQTFEKAYWEGTGHSGGAACPAEHPPPASEQHSAKVAVWRQSVATATWAAALLGIENVISPEVESHALVEGDHPSAVTEQPLDSLLLRTCARLSRRSSASRLLEHSARAVSNAVTPENTPLNQWLSLWNILFAVEGLEFCVPEKRLQLAPCLIQARGCSLPLFLPACLGTLDIEETQEPQYSLRVRLGFDSPLLLQILEIPIPAALTQVESRLESPEGPVDTRHVMLPWRGAVKLRVEARYPLNVVSLELHIAGICDTGQPPLRPGGKK